MTISLKTRPFSAFEAREWSKLSGNDRWWFWNRNLTNIDGVMDDDVIGPITVFSSKYSKFSPEKGPSLLSEELISPHPNGRFFYFLFAWSGSLDEGLHANKNKKIWLAEA